jgi:hypothetical protein
MGITLNQSPLISSAGREAPCRCAAVYANMDQVLNEHTASLGAVEITRREYLQHLDRLRPQKLAQNFWVPTTLFMPRG